MKSLFVVQTLVVVTRWAGGLGGKHGEGGVVVAICSHIFSEIRPQLCMLDIIKVQTRRRARKRVSLTSISGSSKVQHKWVQWVPHLVLNCLALENQCAN